MPASLLENNIGVENEREERLFFLVLDEHFTRSAGIAGEHVIRYCLFANDSCNPVTGTLGIMPFAVHFFHHVRGLGHFS